MEKFVNMWKSICVILAIVCLKKNICALDNGLALTPPMGWLSWQRYRCVTDCDRYPEECISEWLIRNVTDRMVTDGYKDAGYEYVIIDDCWMEMERDPITEELVADRNRFPNGMKALSDYIHAKGLKFGIYEDYGTKTCAGYPGVINHMEIDTKTFAKWNVDYIKLDGCNSDANKMMAGYTKFGQLLNATGRSIVYACSWPQYQESGIMPWYEEVKKQCNLWRFHGDIQDSFKSLYEIIEYYARNGNRYAQHAGPGHWNDPDMLLIGNFGLSIDQSRMQMALWSILAAPLLMSNDLSNINYEQRDILLNPEVIAVNQDKLGLQGNRIDDDNDIITWARQITPVYNGSYSYAVAWSSKRDDGVPYTVTSNLRNLHMYHKGGYKVTDLFGNSNGFDIDDETNFTVRVNPSGVVFYKFVPRN